MQAIILAAGMGKRLKHLTADNTKCMIKVNGVTLIERMLRQLDGIGLSRIVIVVGYKGDKLKQFVSGLDILTPVTFVDNPVYHKTNNIYSLSLAKDYLIKEDSLLFESDVIFEDSILRLIMEDPRETLALVDKYESWMDGTCLRLDEMDRIVDFVSGKDFDFNNIEGCYKTVNIYKFSSSFSMNFYVPFMDAYLKALGENEYYEQVLRVIAFLDNKEIFGIRLNGQKWYEIDDEQDLDIAETLFCPDDEDKVLRLEERYGGYWRFPDVIDFCYLVNPYYPPAKMKDEIRASFDKLLENYPSGMKVNSLLAAKNFGVRRENIIVGNGAAELIKALMEKLTGSTGIIRPTFEEYPNRYGDETIVFTPGNKDFLYSAEDIMDFFEEKEIKNLILINPDNPSGNYIPMEHLKKLIVWCREKKIKLILDESFSDFANEEDNSLIKQKFLDENPDVFIVKSISKSYGIPGLRLGVMASGDSDAIDEFKKNVSIWNINSFAEFYMQIAEKYKKYYVTALERFRKERRFLYTELDRISSIRVIPSEANFFMIELLNGISASELTKRLFILSSILIKDLSSKIREGEYIRVAIRTREENEKLIRTLREVLDSLQK